MGTIDTGRPAEKRPRSVLGGIHVDRNGGVYCVRGRDVQAFDKKGKRLRSWKTAQKAASVAVGEDGRVWVGEFRQVEIFDDKGNLKATWKDPENLGLVTAIELAKDGVFLADALGRAIRRYDLKGKLRFSIGEKHGARGFAVPNGYLDFGRDAKGNLRVANPGKHRVETFSQEGKFLGKFGRFGMRDPAHFRGCCNPTNLAVCPSGRIVVTEKAPPRVKIYDPDGKFLGVFGEKQFDRDCRNMDVAVDQAERIYVSDPIRWSIEIFEPRN